ncbi:hypothetical protein [Salisaeta longa]|uniref:hypothetical protein n=1 Tax=Salisaeta longa TaxID=503170 RepID=UPI0003B34BFB|nr:hypothetical protein [Salisaeta longa]
MNGNTPFRIWCVATWAALLLLVAPLVAMGQAEQLGSRVQRYRVHVRPVLQQYEVAGQSFTQWSTELEAVAPLTPQWQVRARLAGAAVTGAPANVQGFSNVQLGATYVYEDVPGSVLSTVAVDVPVGTKQWDLAELQALGRLSQGPYGFRVTAFGQGWGLTPRVAWAVPLGARFVLGLGASYRYLGPYTPFRQMAGTYDPGDVFTATLGGDLQLSRSDVLSVDGSFSTYATDTANEQPYFSPGNQWTLALRYEHTFAFDRLAVVGFYRYRAQGELQRQDGSGVSALAPERVLPSHGQVHVAYRHRFQYGMYGRVLLRGAHYDASIVLPAQTYGHAQLRWTWRVSDRWGLAPHVGVSIGDVTGGEVGLRTTVFLP